MICALDHTTVLVRDLDVGVAAYREILARKPAYRTKIDGAESVFFTVDNATLRITAPQREGAFGNSIRAALEESGESHLWGLDFRVDNIEKTHRRFKRLSLGPDEISDITLKNLAGDTRSAAVSQTRYLTVFRSPSASLQLRSPIRMSYDQHRS